MKEVRLNPSVYQPNILDNDMHFDASVGIQQEIWNCIDIQLRLNIGQQTKEPTLDNSDSGR